MIDVFQSLTLLGVLGIVVVMQLKISKLSIPVPPMTDERVDDTREQLTAYELERLEREESFDARISQIKNELAKQQSIIKNSGISADELHPLVKNLPHNIIADKHGDIPDTEYAE